LLPPRYRMREPALSTVGRLDRDTSGLLLLTDDGALLHRIISPKAEVAKIYAATLDALGPRHARLILHEGRYHQVRRMFAATGNRVETLQRVAVGALALDALAPGEWRALEADDVARIFADAR